MPVVLLQKDGTEDFLQSFPIGEHILGRGKKLKCTCKKVSRNHGLLKVTNDEGIILKSTHNNPCFYKPQEANNISLLTFNNSIKLNHNDKIALSLDHGWFIVQIKDEQNNGNNDTTVNNANNDTTINNANNDTTINNATTNVDETVLSQSLKRNIEETENDPAAKKQKTETNNLLAPDEIKSEPVDAPSTSNNSVNLVNEIEVKEEPVDNVPEIKQEPLENDVEIKSEPPEKESKDSVVKSECQDDDDKSCDKPSTSGTNKRPWRDRCWYGSKCYRKNGVHRVEFKHPGDSDFDSDTDDTRPICCYGAGCYRKNREHRKRYRHPGQTKLGDRPAPPPPKRRTVRPPVNLLDQDSEELDDYDYSDPFIDDGSEDEYEPSQEIETESEYEDSQEVDEDQKRLLKEAKKFTRGKK